MIDYQQIEAQAAELARQFWLEIEAELARQSLRFELTYQNQASEPAHADTPTVHPHLSEDYERSGI